MAVCQQNSANQGLLDVRSCNTHHSPLTWRQLLAHVIRKQPANVHLPGVSFLRSSASLGGRAPSLREKYSTSPTACDRNNGSCLVACKTHTLLERKVLHLSYDPTACDRNNFCLVACKKSALLSAKFSTSPTACNIIN